VNGDQVGAVTLGTPPGGSQSKARKDGSCSGSEPDARLSGQTLHSAVLPSGTRADRRD